MLFTLSTKNSPKLISVNDVPGKIFLPKAEVFVLKKPKLIISLNNVRGDYCST